MAAEGIRQSGEHLDCEENVMAAEGIRYNPQYYTVDHIRRVIRPATAEEWQDRHRLMSSTRAIVPAYSSSIEHALRAGYTMENPRSEFKRLVRKLEARGAKDPRALAAWIERRKYGPEVFQRMAAAGRRRAAARRRAKSNPVKRSFELRPAYGLDYKTEDQVIRAWKGGKDFEGDYQLGFKLVNIGDIPRPATVILRYDRDRELAVVKED